MTRSDITLLSNHASKYEAVLLANSPLFTAHCDAAVALCKHSAWLLNIAIMFALVNIILFNRLKQKKREED
jgi:hypothetical protein